MNSARMVGLRVYLCRSGMLSAYSVFDSPHVFAAADTTGRLAALLFMLAVSLLGLFDTFVNDVLSKRWQLRFTDARRHTGYVVFALANLALIFVAVSREAEGAFLLRFALDAAMATYVAFKDVQFRFIEPRKETLIHHADHGA